jgi:phage-related protein
MSIEIDTLSLVKPIVFLGDSLARIRDFPEQARSFAGYQLREVQKGHDPSNWKPMKTIGPGVREIRLREAAGAFRVIYLASVGESVVVLHAFQKKTQQTSQKDIDLAASRLMAWKG